MEILTLSFWILVSSAFVVHAHYDTAELTKQFEKWALNVHNESEAKTFDEVIQHFSLKDIITPTLSLDNLPHEKEKRTCNLCKASMQAMINTYKRGILTQDQLNEASLRLCVLISGFEDYVCRGIVNLNLPIFLYIVDHEPKANASSFCGLMYQSEDPSDCPLDDERFEFTVNIPPRGQNTQRLKHQRQLKPLKVIHLSDFHIDPMYEPNGVANCNAPCCCRKGQKPTENSTKAGYWGDYGVCDTPRWALEDALDHVRENNQDIDIIYYTGDTVDHAIWETTYASCDEEIRYATQKCKETFPNIPFYPVIGNHDAQPMNAFAPDKVTSPTLSTGWLYELLIKQWSPWLPQDTFETIRKGGYYTTLAKPGFRIIGLNSNVAYHYNWWVVLTPKDPDDQLQWLSDTLYKAEQSNEIVHILSHIPAGFREHYRPWGREYKRVIDRFSHIIAAEFNGHMHTDQFKIFYDNDDLKPTHAAWNGGSLVTYYSFNINYKVMYLDQNTYVPNDIDVYSYNLTEANLTPNQRPLWFKLYSFKEAFGVDSLEAKDLDKLVNRMATTEKNLLKQYIHYYGKAGDAFLEIMEKERSTLGADYDFKYICDIVTTSLDDRRKCNELKVKYKN